MPDRGNRALHYENLSASVLRDPSKFSGTLRNGTHRSQYTAILDLAHTRRDQILLDGFLVNSLQQCSNVGLICFDDFLQYFLRVFITRLHSFEIQNGETAQFVHGDGKMHVDHSIHGAGEDWDFQPKWLCVFTRQTENDVDFIRVDGYPPRYKRDFVEPVGHTRLAISAYPHPHI